MSEVQLILRNDIDGVGKRGDIVSVAKGYARNYLVPRGLAIPASEGAAAQAAAMRRSRDLKDAKAREGAQEIAKRLVATVITITAKAGGEGKLFGSVTTIDVAEAVAEQTGLTVDRKDLRLDEPIKTVGQHQVVAHLHAEVEFPITVEVVAG